jgi:3-deoxy-D-manno-octulosonic-acid transferase
MTSIRIRRFRRFMVVAVLVAASSILPLADLHAASRGESQDRPERIRVVRQSFPFWSFLVSLWDKAGLRIDDNG